jgi:hypothetical protein
MVTQGIKKRKCEFCKASLPLIRVNMLVHLTDMALMAIALVCTYAGINELCFLFNAIIGLHTLFFVRFFLALKYAKFPKTNVWSCPRPIRKSKGTKSGAKGTKAPILGTAGVTVHSPTAESGPTNEMMSVASPQELEEVLSSPTRLLQTQMV